MRAAGALGAAPSLGLHLPSKVNTWFWKPQLLVPASLMPRRVIRPKQSRFYERPGSPVFFRRCPGMARVNQVMPSRQAEGARTRLQQSRQLDTQVYQRAGNGVD